ncbi:MAG: GTP cyclohydrolase II [Pseudomonadota bacterium]
MSRNDQALSSSESPSGVPSQRFSRQASLRAVDRATGDLRRGDPVLVRPDVGPALLIMAAESAADQALDRMISLGGGVPSIILTGQRAVTLGLSRKPDGVLLLRLAKRPEAAWIRAMADPLESVPEGSLNGLEGPHFDEDSKTGAVAATRLLKLARLLPAALAIEVERPLATDRLAANSDTLSVAAFDIDHYQAHAARSLRRVADARVPLDGAEVTDIVAFRPTDGGQEHLAIIIGTPAPDQPVLVRLHSECFTGDLLGSLRCDCGPQLRGAVGEIAKQGGGILLYLAQEGRGIGLINKLRAYRLQDADFDTVDANEMLGYDADERLYLPAAEMLRQLGFSRVRLMTNNPEKVGDLNAMGIDVIERVPHIFPANGHNEFYLRTKKLRTGHLI